MSAPANARWGVDADAILRTLWADHLPTAEIAARLGCSRNAVIGRASRLELPARRASNKVARSVQSGGDDKARPRVPIPIAKPRREEVEDSIPLPAARAPGMPTRWADMAPGQCRNIIGEEEDVFDRLVCGNAAVLGSSYCPACRSRMWCTPDQVLKALKRASARSSGGAA